MPRALRPQVADLVYHVGSRGCEKRDIFDVVPADREFFLWLLGKVVTKYRWRLHAYCLMGNHFHLVLETPQANLAVGMQYLKSVYAQWFNGVHPEREGVLFERRSSVAHRDRGALPLRARALRRAQPGSLRLDAETRGVGMEQLRRDHRTCAGAVVPHR